MLWIWLSPPSIGKDIPEEIAHWTLRHVQRSGQMVIDDGQAQSFRLLQPRHPSKRVR